MKNVVIVKGIGGIGNRLRTITAALEYAIETRRGIFVDWSDGMFAPLGENVFNHYFTLSFEETVNSWSQIDSDTYYPCVYKELDKRQDFYFYFRRNEIKNRYFRKIFRYLISALPKKCISIERLETSLCLRYLSYQLKDEYIEQFGETGGFPIGEHLPSNINSDAVLFIDNVPFYDPRNMKKYIHLQKTVEEEIDLFVRKNLLDRNSLGIHIRAASKKMFGNVDKMLPKLDKYIRRHNIIRIFLATDSLQVENLFKIKYGDACVVYPKYLPESNKTDLLYLERDSKDRELQERMTKEAIMDMFILSKTEFLLYHYGSTFSEISKVYHRDSKKCKSWITL